MDEHRIEEPIAETKFQHLGVAAAAAFCTYFCMYAFRKPFTAATYEGLSLGGWELKALLVNFQLTGYMISKFMGIKVVSEMPANRRAIAILVLILIAELALIGFAIAPIPLKLFMLLINGLPLGMIFGFVLGYLEGRQQTEALSAVLCASFIMASGVVKSVGRWLIQVQNVDEFWMPAITGALFLPPLFLSVWALSRTPAPSLKDIEARAQRKTVNRDQRKAFLAAYFPGLAALVLVYVVLTIVRTIRDDFAVEIWQELGVGSEPQIFARSETVVAVIATVLNGLVFLVRGNLTAMRITIGMMCVAFCLVAASAVFDISGNLAPFPFMVACGVGLYIPYVAFHTTLFERLIAISRRPSNLGFLMYVADAIGYLGYALVLTFSFVADASLEVLPIFRFVLIAGSALSALALLFSWTYFEKKLR